MRLISVLPVCTNDSIDKINNEHDHFKSTIVCVVSK